MSAPAVALVVLTATTPPTWEHLAWDAYERARVCDAQREVLRVEVARLIEAAPEPVETTPAWVPWVVAGAAVAGVVLGAAVVAVAVGGGE